MEFNDNKYRRVYNIDLDGTLTNGELFWKSEPTPNEAMVKKAIALYKAGNIIIVWTARSWNCAPETVAWLTKYSIPYHGVKMEKGGADCYIDDKNVLIMDIVPVEPVEPPDDEIEDVAPALDFPDFTVLNDHKDYHNVDVGDEIRVGKDEYREVVAKSDGKLLVKDARR